MLILLFSLVVKAVLLCTWQEPSAEELNEGKVVFCLCRKKDS
jgi:hypothetical protein